jgi:hypothetical protein
MCRWLPLSFVVLAPLAACSAPELVVGDLEEVAVMKAIPNRDLDILFVIDNSISMMDEQSALAAAFPQMIDVLSQVDGGLPNLRIGVVTSDMGTSVSTGDPAPPAGDVQTGGCKGVGEDGVLRTVPAMTEAFLSDVDDNGTRVRNFTGELRDVFSELAQVGALGCGFEQHLAAMRRAIEQPANAGFLRPEANLAVVIVADEDDCSIAHPAFFSDDPALGRRESFRCFEHGVTCDPDTASLGDKSNCVPREDGALVEGVEPFVQALLATKPDPRMIMVAAVVGDPDVVRVANVPRGQTYAPALEPSCVYRAADYESQAFPAVRLAGFLDAFPGRATLTSLCSGDLSSPLGTIGATAKKLVGDPCLDTRQLADSSPEPGIQPSCEVVDIRDAEPWAVRRLATCGSGSSDCYELVADPVACPSTPDHLRVRIQRSSAVTDDTWTHVRCQRAD